jgi:hypothetical protein
MVGLLENEGQLAAYFILPPAAESRRAGQRGAVPHRPADFLDEAQPATACFHSLRRACPELCLVMQIEGLFQLGSWASRTAGAVKQTVAGLDGIVDGVGADVVVDLPQAETHKGHLVATVELDGG